MAGRAQQSSARRPLRRRPLRRPSSLPAKRPGIDHQPDRFVALLLTRPRSSSGRRWCNSSARQPQRSRPICPGCRGCRGSSACCVCAGSRRTGPREALRQGGDLSELQERLYRNVYRLGRTPGWLLRVRRRRLTSMAVGRSLYDILDIDFHGSVSGSDSGSGSGEITISRCYFSSFYSPEVCRMMSVMDRGLLAGRQVEAIPCLASVSRKDSPAAAPALRWQAVSLQPDRGRSKQDETCACDRQRRRGATAAKELQGSLTSPCWRPATCSVPCPSAWRTLKG